MTLLQSGTSTPSCFCYTHDLMKNVSALFNEQMERCALYEYQPFGDLLSSEGDMAQEKKFRFSCEYIDDELGLAYYNYRYYNPMYGRWIGRDPLEEEETYNLYLHTNNSPCLFNDRLGLLAFPIIPVLLVLGRLAVRYGPKAIKMLRRNVPKKAPKKAPTNKPKSDPKYDSKPQSKEKPKKNDSPKKKKKDKGCKPCRPPVGTMLQRSDNKGKHKHYDKAAGCELDEHYHIYKVGQSPPPACQCFNKNTGIALPTNPGYAEVNGPVSGGGPK